MCEFASVLKRLRKAKGLSGRELCRIAKLKESSVSHYETGRRVPRPDTLREIAKALAVPHVLLMWFAYTAPEIDAKESEIFHQVEKTMTHQVKLFEKYLSHEASCKH